MSSNTRGPVTASAEGRQATSAKPAPQAGSPAPARLGPEWNVGHVDPELPTPPVRLVFRHFLASALIYGALLLILTFHPWYKNLLQVSVMDLKALHVYFWLYGAYLVISPLVFLWLRPRSLWNSKNLLIAGVCRRAVRGIWLRCRGRGAPALQISYKEKHALMFLLIKVFYGPLMLNSAFLEYNRLGDLAWQLWQAPALLWQEEGYVSFASLVSLVFLTDSAFFFMGYHTEAAFLNNQVRYVETNLRRIAVTVACYAPFNMVTSSFFGPSSYDFRVFWLGGLAQPVTWLLRGAAVLFLLVLISSTLSLFTRASNLTNRGIVTWGAYRFVRHPGYFGKVMFWFTTVIPFLVPHPARPTFSWSAYTVSALVTLSGFLGWALIYYLRAITEEEFLGRDPEYIAYCQQVKYRFIPGVC